MRPTRDYNGSSRAVISSTCEFNFKFRSAMLLQETILCATAPTNPTAGSGSIFLHDIQTGATLASFKQTNAGPHSLATLKSKSTQGGFILASQPDKSIMNVYNFQKVSFMPSSGADLLTFPLQDQMSLKIVLPEKLTCIALDHRGDFCAGGTAAGRIYLWEVRLLAHRFLFPKLTACRPPQGSCITHGMLITDKSTFCASQTTVPP